MATLGDNRGKGRRAWRPGSVASGRDRPIIQKMRERRGRVVFLVGMAIAVASCRRFDQLQDTLRELQEVQQQVSERVGTHDVRVNLNNGQFLTIGIANSSWQSLPPDEKREKALGLAKLAYASLASTSRVEVVTVTFADRRTYFHLIHYSKVLDAFQFGVTQLAATAEPVSSERWVPKETPQRDLYFAAIGDVPPAWLNDLTWHFEKRFGTRITLLPGLALDRVTFDPTRSQTVADELISAIRQRYATLARDDRARVIGVTPYDMYTRETASRWQFAFSLRSGDDHVAVVSYARLDPVTLGEPPDAERLRSRLRKMVAKNIGIMYYGLPLSHDPRSVLYGQIGGVDELDRMTEYFEPDHSTAIDRQAIPPR